MGLPGRNRIVQRGLLPLVCLLASAPALGDVVYLKGGFQVEGRVVKVEKRRILLETMTGLKSIPRVRVLRIQRKPWLPGEFRDRLEKARKSKGLKRLKALLDWALNPGRKEKLAPLLPELFKLLLERDPENEAARKALGFVRFEGKWVTSEEKTALEEERKKEEARKAREKVEKKMAEAARYGGTPLPEQIADEAASDRADAWALAGTLGVPSVTVLSSRRISVQGFLTQGEARSLLDLGERALSTWGEEIFGNVAFNPFMARRAKFHYYLVRAGDLPPMTAYVAKAHGGVNAEDRRFFSNWGLGIPPNGWDHYCVMLLERNPLDLEGPFVRALARSWAESSADARLMPWFPEGFALVAARRALGSPLPVEVEFSLGGRPYSFTDGVRWPWLALTLGRIAKDPPLSEIFLQSDSSLTVYDVAKASGLAAMLWEKDPRDIGLLIRYLGYKHGTQPWAVKELFHRSPEEVDRLYRLWAARQGR